MASSTASEEPKGDMEEEKGEKAENGGQMEEDSAAAKEEKTKPIPDYASFTRIEEFGYAFNDKGQLRDLATGEPFEFAVHGAGKTPANQRRYEALGEVVTLEVFRLLEKEGLRRIPVPLDAAEDEPQSFVFASDGAEEAQDLLILIHGTGVVRAGQWARRLIINRDLDWGTQLPYVRRAKELGWAVLVLNTNYNQDPLRGKRRIRGSEGPDRHGLYVWEEWVEGRAKASRIAIVAHSAGGWVTGAIAHSHGRSFARRVKAVVFTDSFCKPHKHISQVGMNWVTSKAPLDTPLRQSSTSEVDEVSAGTLVHEETSHAAIEPIWAFMTEAMAAAKEGKLLSHKPKKASPKTSPLAVKSSPSSAADPSEESKAGDKTPPGSPELAAGKSPVKSAATSPATSPAKSPAKSPVKSAAKSPAKSPPAGSPEAEEQTEKGTKRKEEAGAASAAKRRELADL